MYKNQTNHRVKGSCNLHNLILAAQKRLAPGRLEVVKKPTGCSGIALGEAAWMGITMGFLVKISAEFY
jgi:hypothetical protein